MSDPVDTYRMPLMEHLRELRTRLIVCLWTLGITISVSFLFANEIFVLLAAPMNAALLETGRGTMAVTQAMEGFMVQMKVAGLTSLFLSSPILFWQAWKFVGPGLYDQEKRLVFPLVAASTALFLSGAVFCYFAVFRFGFPMFLDMNIEGVQAVLSIDSYLGMVTTLLVAFGVSFQLPIVIYFLARLGIIDHIDMIKGFRYSVVAIFVVAAILTPPDVVSQMLMAAPLLFLYGIGIVVARFTSRKKREKPAA
ncbi:MAG: twin-arginine translocase subunit TatC [Pseudomonadota bacterium]|nr:twin-arginine translocase subunit TatC [Pseudomonadota bacterium]